MSSKKSISRVGVKDGSNLIYDGGNSSLDSEFEYADEIKPQLARMMAEVENGPRHTTTSTQTLEEFHRLHESNEQSRRKYRWENQDELKSQRVGRILHMNAFLGKLKDAGVNAWYTEKGGMPGTLGLYCSKNEVPVYIGFAQVPLMQEYEELYFDEYDVPLGPKRRGWRTLILKLIDAGFLTEASAHAAFGEPATGPVSRRYREYLKFIRQRSV